MFKSSSNLWTVHSVQAMNVLSHIYTCTHSHMQLYRHMFMHAHTYMCTCSCMHARTHACIRAHERWIWECCAPTKTVINRSPRGVPDTTEVACADHEVTARGVLRMLFDSHWLWKLGDLVGYWCFWYVRMIHIVSRDLAACSCASVDAVLGDGCILCSKAFRCVPRQRLSNKLNC